LELINTYENPPIANNNHNCLHEEEYEMGAVRRIALALVIIGALNWGLIAFFQFDLVASLFGGQDTFLARAVYAIVAISGLICLGLLFKPDEDREVTTTRRRISSPAMNTEFGEEPDFKKERELSDKKDEL
jgi:uncharacterized membrane protein YuzA (DUF378 family)